ncbi:hypothetical protein SCLCIDRAFT_186996 [Scleroderma citrinum Foug A]|uniref:DUF6741 domain-containing protein n=1 Tax=Scleroderma citrinum Foug A TaxID=1036808 RepID=A0A0C3DLU5_9AGAM|nr:hypothetical protein SCLCIDRAFT_186996 [Scleroderma citrinum Foug A]
MSPVDLRDLGKVKFKRRGASRSGITLCDAQSDMLLSGQYSCTLGHLGVNHITRKIFVNLRLHGYSPVNYEVPVDSYNNLVDLNSLARRIGRAAGHYLQRNAIYVPWDRVEIQYLEEVAFETWRLKMRIL